MKITNCLECNKKVTPNAKWCNSECKKKFLLNHYAKEDCVKWLKEEKIEKKRIAYLEKEIKDIWQIIREKDNYLFGTVSKSLIELEATIKNEKEIFKILKVKAKDRKELMAFLEEYIRVFKSNRKHQKFHKKEPCPKCELAERLLKKLKQ